MSRQYKRSVNVIVGNKESINIPNALSIEKLRISFYIEKDWWGMPNQAKISIYNLSPTSRAKIEKEYTKIAVNAGYEGSVSLIFTGDIINVFHSKRETDVITEIYASDGGFAYKNSFFNQTLFPGISREQTIRKVAESFGLSIGQIEGIPEGNSSLAGQTLSMPSKDLMNELADENNANWSVQNGQIQTVAKDGYLPGEVLTVSPITGMIGSPIITVMGANAKILLDPKVHVGRRFKIEAAYPNVALGDYYFPDITPLSGTGTYRITKVTHTGDTHADPWYSLIEGFSL